MNHTARQPVPTRRTTPAMSQTPRSVRLFRPTRVVLRVWGCTDADIKRAEDNARHSFFSQKWEVVEVIPSTGAPCPIPPRDPIALNQDAVYDAAWAAYPAEAAR
jgi:hypothetical protein